MEIKLPQVLSSYPGTSRNGAVPALPLSLLSSTAGDIEAVKNVKNAERVEEPVNTQETDAGEPELDRETLRDVMKRTSELASVLDRSLKFEIHEDADMVQIHVIDTTDGRIVRKIPSDEVLKLVAQIKEKMSDRVDVKA
jgi:flagellar protein FlaG